MLPHAVATMIADSEWTVEMGTGSEAVLQAPRVLRCGIPAESPHGEDSRGHTQ